MQYCKFRKTVDNVRGVFGKNGDDIVPTHNRLICCKDIEYSKFRVLNMEEFEELMKRRCINEFSVIGDFRTFVPDEGCEFIEFKYTNAKEELKVLIAPRMSLYIMSQIGKTLDSLICY